MSSASDPNACDILSFIEGADLNALREGIDACDDGILALLVRRGRLAQAVGALKAQSSASTYVPARERRILERLLAKPLDPLPSKSVASIFREIISASLALESSLRVAFAGFEGGVAHLAAKGHFGLSAQLNAMGTAEDVFTEVARGRAALGVVPLESTEEGVATRVLELFIKHDVWITAEIGVVLQHYLLSQAQSTGEIKEVHGTAEDLRACQDWLMRSLPHARQCVMAISQKDASAPAAWSSELLGLGARAAEDGSVALLGTDLAVSAAQLPIFAKDIANLRGRRARFLVLGPRGDVPVPTGSGDQTSVLFRIQGTTGELVQALAPLAKHGIDLLRIESRPSRRCVGEYLFFIDLQGHMDDTKVAAAIAELKSHCTYLRILGACPKAHELVGLPNEWAS